MNTKQIAIGVVVLLVMGLGAYFIFSVGMSGVPFTNINEEGFSIKPDLVSFNSDELSLSFGYPKDYLLEERVIDIGERFHKQIILLEDNGTNRSLMSGELVGDGPMSVNIDVFQNNLDNYTAESFITNNSYSNYKMGDGELIPVNVSGVDGYAYRWDGLYKGESVVFATDEYVYMVSVTYLTDTDRIIQDFMSVIGTFTIKD